jgi:PAS domain S-box-containing protein
MPLTDRYRWLFRRSPSLLVALDKEGYFVDASDAWVERFGYTREELAQLRPHDLATPESAALIEKEYLPMLRRRGRLEHAAIDLLTKSGERVNCIARAVSERSEAGDFVRTVAVYREINRELKLEQHYRDLYRATPAMLHAVDAKGRIVYVSDHWLRKLGYRREEVIGRPVTDFMSEGTRAALTQDQLENVIAQGALQNEPRDFVTREGEVIEALISSAENRDENGKVVGLLVACKDVTERNRAERQLRAAFEENARLREELERERDYLREEVQISMNFGRMIGESPALKKMLARLEAVAQTDASVLIQGESGVGKELVAHVIHAASARADAPLVKVNCAAVPQELFESEFFGHIKGAFTGAHRDRVGRFELADGGTIFLDEVGEIPLSLQSKLLRVLQEGEYERVGDEKTRTVNVRVIAATNRDLEQAVAEGRFREDLFYRLSVFPIDVPALRERGEDVVQLALHFLERTCKDFGHSPLTLSKQQAALLKKYDWPGNIRELKNVIERAVILSQGKVLRLDLAMANILEERAESGVVAQAEGDRHRIMTDEELTDLGRRNMLNALRAADWRVSGPKGAARLLGLKPTTLADRMRKMGITRPEVSAGG